ncbi:DUF551 domain-containing protein [Salmonella enterica]|nr:DUF551 domain-containing protein [Salmonella enterica subsp. enterica]EMC9473289.1 DUF551 domain-containing protein [Salmonella enterica]
MTTITREQLHERARRKVKELEFAITQSAFTSIRDGLEEELELARIALASLDAEPVSQTYNLPELIEGMEVSIDVSTCDADAGNRYFGTVTEVSELYTAKNGYILLVQDAKPNFDVNGNTPVQSPIDHGYRPECECSGCKATARICAELNNEEAEIFADGYNAAMQSFGNSEQLNSPVTPDGWISCSERMPNDKDYVWCWGKSYGWTECDTFEGYYDWSRNKWWAVTDDVEEPASKVTHWMPLPEPPQEVK